MDGALGWNFFIKKRKKRKRKKTKVPWVLWKGGLAIGLGTAAAMAIVAS